jgi:NADPH:quinone reductase-like Zn-dependent oxidoreductase
VLGIVNRNGAFAEYLTLPVENLHVVPEELSTDAATFAEPLAAALEIQQQIEIRPGDRVLVVGDGKLGQLIAQTLTLTGCTLTAVGHHPQKLALLAQRGITTRLASDLGSEKFDVAVECSGNSGGFALARSALRPRGTLVLKSTYAGDLTLDASAIVVDEITMVGSRCGPFPPALGPWGAPASRECSRSCWRWIEPDVQSWELRGMSHEVLDRIRSRRQALTALVFAGVALFPLSGSAQNVDAGTYPNPRRDIRHIIPWGAGGATDAAMRGFMQYLVLARPS